MKKKVFEVVQLPKDANPEELCKELDATSFKACSGGVFIFLFIL
jgi:hypothetical protein